MFQLKPVSLSDLELCYQFINELENGELDFDLFSKVFHLNLQNPQVSYFLIESDAENVGFVSLHFQWLLHHTGKVGEIQEFFIKESFRNKGLGQKVIDAIVTKAKENDFELLEVSTNKKREANLHIYQKFGFDWSHYKFTWPLKKS